MLRPPLDQYDVGTNGGELEQFRKFPTRSASYMSTDGLIALWRLVREGGRLHIQLLRS